GSGVHDLDLVDAELSDLLNDRFGKRLESAGDDEAFFLIGGVLDENLVLEVIQLLSFLDGKLFHIVKELQYLFVGTASLLGILVLALAFDIEEGQSAEQRRGQKLPAAFLTIKIDVKKVAGIELCFVP